MPAYDPRVLNTQVPRSSKKRATAFAKKFLIVKKPRPVKNVKFRVQKVKKKYTNVFKKNVIWRRYNSLTDT